MTELSDILELVGELDDGSGKDTPRERFRAHLRNKLRDVSVTRDYVEECLRTPKDQYNRALQDLVNHLGTFLGFEVTFGRYRGVQGQVGFDGHWVSPTGLHVIVEVKTTDAYSIKTSTLLHYIHELVSDQVIPETDAALGLYIIGRSDSASNALASSITAEKQTHRLRIVSVESLLTLADIKKDYELTHESVLTVIRPSGPRIDPVVNLLTDVLAEPRPASDDQPTEKPSPQPEPEVPKPPPDGAGPNYWLTPVATDDEMTADEVIEKLVGKHRIYALATNTPGRKSLKAGDRVCWYAQTKGIVAHATLSTGALEKEHPAVRNASKFRWVFEVVDAEFYFDNPVILDKELRGQLSLFGNQEKSKSWGLFVRSTRKVSPEDFKLLTR